MSPAPLFRTDFAQWPLRRGKVRDVYDLGTRLVMIASDRVSAFDVVMPTPIPDKGRILTSLTQFWIEYLNEDAEFFRNDQIETDPLKMGEPFASNAEMLRGRTVMVRKARVYPYECVVRGYLAGSGWKEYQASGTVCGERLPTGLQLGSKLPEPIFTPATKVEQGHDENVSFARMEADLGGIAYTLRKRSLAVYETAAEYAATCGILLADTKFEWGDDDGLVLVDEILTPDSSRFWPADQWQPGVNPPSFDKQYLRDWLAACWDGKGPPPELPQEVVEQSRLRYHEAHERLTGRRVDASEFRA